MSLNRSVCVGFGGGAVLQSLLEMSSGYLVLTAAGTGTYLGVITSGQADVGVVGFEMNMAVKSIGEHLNALPRGDFASGLGPGAHVAWQNTDGMP
jgi:predicted regulator of Ras-like GTPase activity (Roadblock/LC7/MglB family)